jgi:hypothetical protein
MGWAVHVAHLRQKGNAHKVDDLEKLGVDWIITLKSIVKE